MVCSGGVKRGEIIGVDDEGVADEEVSEMRCEKRIHAASHKAFLEGLIDNEVWVLIGRAEERGSGDIGGVGGKAGLNRTVFVDGRWLKRSVE